MIFVLDICSLLNSVSVVDCVTVDCHAVMVRCFLCFVYRKFRRSTT